jgi:hypothetical protein
MKHLKQILVGLLTLAALTVYVPSTDGGDVATAANPGTVDAPLISCSDVNADGSVAGTDFFALLGKFGTTFPALNFSYLYDLNADDAVAGPDFFLILGDFGQACPAVDTEVALATLWGIGGAPANCPGGPPPAPPLVENEAAIEAIGYYRSSTDVPGQGVHYTKAELFDAVFDPCRPEGLVYSGGRLVAQLYVLFGGDTEDPGIGWNGWTPPVCPASGCGTAINDVDIDTFCTSSPCSWSTDEGWHAHANLCTGFVGTTSAFAIPGQTEAQCDTGTGSQPRCTEPVTAQPCWDWNYRVGWMGHLWNHDLNENMVPDLGGNNGRFSDCAPPAKNATSCPM